MGTPGSLSIRVVDKQEKVNEFLKFIQSVMEVHLSNWVINYQILEKFLQYPPYEGGAKNFLLDVINVENYKKKIGNWHEIEVADVSDLKKRVKEFVSKKLC